MGRSDLRRFQVVVDPNLVFDIKQVMGKRILESNETRILTFTAIINDLLKERLEELKVE